MNKEVKQIFDILGVEPEEEFKIKGWDKKYKFDTSLQLFFMNICNNDNWQQSLNTIGDVICRGITKIPQKPKLTNKDKVAIKFLKNCGFHYVARDKNMELYAYSNKPHKESFDGLHKWVVTEGFCTEVGLSMQNNILGSISWEDDGHKSLFCLDDFSDEELREN